MRQRIKGLRMPASVALYGAEVGSYAVALVLLIFVAANLFLSDVKATQAQRAMPDMQLWSPSRKAAYFDALAQDQGKLLGSLHVPTLDLDVPVYGSASELNMDRGAGVVDGMAYPHELGHIGIAGHRDGYFRALKDIKTGDTIELATVNGPKHFVVDELLIVAPEDLQHLQETDQQRLTLVTCYPFYFVGDAPQRFLVRAELAESAPDGPNH